MAYVRDERKMFLFHTNLCQFFATRCIGGQGRTGGNPIKLGRLVTISVVPGFSFLKEKSSKIKSGKQQSANSVGCRLISEVARGETILQCIFRVSFQESWVFLRISVQAQLKAVCWSTDALYWMWLAC